MRVSCSSAGVAIRAVDEPRAERVAEAAAQGPREQDLLLVVGSVEPGGSDRLCAEKCVGEQHVRSRADHDAGGELEIVTGLQAFEVAAGAGGEIERIVEADAPFGGAPAPLAVQFDRPQAAPKCPPT